MLTRHVTRILGYAGLIPFVVPALLVLFGTQHASLSNSIAEAYSFGIVSFLCGSWWGMALRSGSRKTLILSNAYFIVAFLVFVFLPNWWSLTAALLLISISITEQSLVRLFALPRFYRRMRVVLTAVASASMLTLHLAT